MSTKVEVARLRSVMEFVLDTAALEKFEKLTKGIRLSSVNLARTLKVTEGNLSSVSSKLKSVNNGISAANSKRGAANIATTYASLTKNVNTADASLKRLNITLGIIDPKLGQQTIAVGKLSDKWKDLALKVKDANTQLRQRPSGVRASPRGSYNPSGGGGGGGSPRQGGGMGAGFAGGLIARNLGNFINPALMGGAAAGYGFKEIVQTGREYMKMKNVLLASSKNTEDFNTNLKFTVDTTNRLGTNVTEFGSAYAKMLQAVGGKMDKLKTQEVFTNFSELMVVLGSSDDDQKGIFRAMSQMFSKGKIQMEEINQMAERNVPALMMLTRAYKEMGWTEEEFEKKQREGKLKPEEFFVYFAKYAKEFATNNDALKKAMESSVTQQGIFMNKLRETANKIMEGGLDKALGQMFQGFTQLAISLAPVAIWLTKVAMGFAEVVKWMVNFGKEHPVITGALALIAGGFFGVRAGMKAGMTMGAAFFALMIRGLQALKVAMIKTAVLAVLIGIAEVMVSLYEHMNGETNWVSLMIASMKWLGSEIEVVYEKFLTFLTAIKVAFRDSFIGEFFKKIFNFDFATAVNGGVGGFNNSPSGAIGANGRQYGTPPVLARSQNHGLDKTAQDNIARAANQISTIPTGNLRGMYGKVDVGFEVKFNNNGQIVTKKSNQIVDVGGMGMYNK